MICNDTNITLPEAVFWDWDGTLVDSYGFLNDAHNHTLQTLGFPIFKEGEYAQYFGKPREILYPAIYKEKTDEAKDIFGKYVSENSHKIKFLNDTKLILDFFHQKKIPMGIVSNKQSEFIALEVDHFGWKPYFSVIIGAGEAHADKPSSAPLLLALDRAGLTHIPKNKIWYFGDTENDLACAKGAGCHALFLNDHIINKVLIEDYNPLIIFDNYKELTEFLVAK